MSVDNIKPNLSFGNLNYVLTLITIVAIAWGVWQNAKDGAYKEGVNDTKIAYDSQAIIDNKIIANEKSEAVASQAKRRIENTKIIESLKAKITHLELSHKIDVQLLTLRLEEAREEAKEWKRKYENKK